MPGEYKIKIKRTFFLTIIRANLQLVVWVWKDKIFFIYLLIRVGKVGTVVRVWASVTESHLGVSFPFLLTDQHFGINLKKKEIYLQYIYEKQKI